MRIVFGFILCLAVLAAAALGIVYSGAYNVASTVPHNPVVRWALDTTMHNSVAAHAEGVVAPASFTEAEVQQGAHRFSEMCVVCHGAPGVEPAEIGKGLRPDPPALSDAVGHWNREELFWILRNGIKMAGMPAFGPTHSDKELWPIVAFLERLPDLSPEQYQQMAKSEDQGGHHHGHEAAAR